MRVLVSLMTLFFVSSAYSEPCSPQIDRFSDASNEFFASAKEARDTLDSIADLIATGPQSQIEKKCKIGSLYLETMNDEYIVAQKTAKKLKRCFVQRGINSGAEQMNEFQRSYREVRKNIYDLYSRPEVCGA